MKNTKPRKPRVLWMPGRRTACPRLGRAPTREFRAVGLQYKAAVTVNAPARFGYRTPIRANTGYNSEVNLLITRYQ